MASTRPLIHIGYPKTASTWLQQVVFLNENTGFYAPWGAPAESVRKQFFNSDGFHVSAETARSQLEPGLIEAIKQSLIPVFSNEMLTGFPSTGRGWSKEIVHRIHDIFPEGKVFIVIREQKSMLLSSYRQHLMMGGTLSINDFIVIEKTPRSLKHSCCVDFFYYDKIIDYYRNVFGRDNVLVLPFELFKQNKQIFCEKLLSFAEANGKVDYSQSPKNVGTQGGKLSVLRPLNSVFNIWFSPFHKPTIPLRHKMAAGIALLIPETIHEGIENRLRQFIAQNVGDLYRLSNQKTSQLIGINLADLGYDA
jgi:hypothetical protein